MKLCCGFRMYYVWVVTNIACLQYVFDYFVSICHQGILKFELPPPSTSVLMFEAPSVLNIHTPTSSFAIIHSRWLPEHLGVVQSADNPLY
jgi:hypothetical protein